ncbi:hypothetical protein KSS93_16850 [Pseudomonas xanthosomatis]|uniref:hypothetical protein n=1 Tax=Pseudomonas xanthosomatis TaxID=2842356 RepID=UPI001C3E7A10|nr:hypothetical protein [Pseudomonas xanthosomatis]QXH44553.1 hypothetical protein KSS93_16850 [Pseudomonas xanthosomatis]
MGNRAWLYLQTEQDSDTPAIDVASVKNCLPALCFAGSANALPRATYGECWSCTSALLSKCPVKPEVN